MLITKRQTMQSSGETARPQLNLYWLQNPQYPHLRLKSLFKYKISQFMSHILLSKQKQNNKQLHTYISKFKKKSTIVIIFT